MDRWQAEYIDFAECKPEGDRANVIVRVGWAPWRDEQGREHPHTTTWEPLEALGLSASDIRQLVAPDTRLRLPHTAKGLDRQERAAVETARVILGLKRDRPRAGGKARPRGPRKGPARTRKS